MKRKLASIQKIDTLDPIENADKIERAGVMGWTVVVKKGEFKVGDPCVFFEVDAVLPKDAPWAEFMASKNFRVKSCRLRGTLSQGLVLPLSILSGVGGGFLEIGSDVTALLKVEQYVAPEKNDLIFAGPFITRTPQTDEVRIQSFMHMLEALKGKPYYITEKADGTSCTVGKTDDKLYVCSRSDEIKEGDNWYWKGARRHHVTDAVFMDTSVQGEVCGPGIQKNRLNLPEIDMLVFDIWDIRKGEYRPWDEVLGFCRQYAITTVRELERGEKFNYCLDDLLAMTDGLYPGTQNRREGIVIRPLIPERLPTGDRLSFKCLSNAFLLKDEL